MSRDKVTISEEAKKKFQKLLDEEIARREGKEGVEVINVEITEKNSDYMVFFSAGVVATTSIVILAYFFSLLFKG